VPELTRDGVTIAYDVFGAGEPVVLVCGCGQPAVAWQLTLVPALVEAGYQVVTFDNRGVAPSSSPPPPYSVADMVADTLGLLDHLGMETVRIAGHSMGGWIVETMAIRHPERVLGAVMMGSCNVATSWEKAITTVERDLARLDFALPPLFYATETLRYLPNRDLQDDGVVDAWLGMIGDLEPWPNPGRLGQYEAALAWSLDLERVQGW
jgi:pimeloyl-ACP methyl ester carboxylesterase